MERYIIFIIILGSGVGTAILFRWLRYLSNKKAKEKRITVSNIIRQPKAYLYIGIACTLFFLGIAIFALLMPKSMLSDQEDDGARLLGAVIFGMLGLISIIIALIQINWKIEIGKDEFSFTNTFRKKRTYKFNDVEVKLLSRSTRLYYNGKHIVGISYLQENWDALENAIAAYQKKQGRTPDN